MGTKVTRLLLAVATILSLAASACDGVSLPTTPSPTSSATPTPATYRVSGYVTHDEFFSLRGARVEVTAGAARDTTYTDADGRFVFDGMPGGDAEVTATKEGYESSVQRVHVTRDVDQVNFALKPFGYIDITGTYSLRITADCHDLPGDARTRTYTALLRRNGAGFGVTLHGPEDFLASNGFFGGMDEQGLWFGTGHYDADYPPLLEPLTPSTALRISFDVRPTVSPTRLVGTMRGELAIVPIVDRVVYYMNPVVSCESASHQFLMSRQ